MVKLDKKSFLKIKRYINLRCSLNYLFKACTIFTLLHWYLWSLWEIVILTYDLWTTIKPESVSNKRVSPNKLNRMSYFYWHIFNKTKAGSQFSKVTHFYYGIAPIPCFLLLGCIVETTVFFTTGYGICQGVILPMNRAALLSTTVKSATSTIPSPLMSSER